MKRSAAAWTLPALLALAACEAEPAKVPEDAQTVDRGRQVDPDMARPDEGPADGGPDGGPADAAPDQGVVCADTMAGEPVFRLVVLHAAGGRSALVSDGDNGGSARFVARLKRLQLDAAQVEQAAVVTLSSGDGFLAGATFAVSLSQGVPYYDGQVVAAAGFDAVALGNHDFDFGPDVLANFIRSTTPAAPDPPEGDAGVPEVESAPAFLTTNLDVTAEPSLQALAVAGRLVTSQVVTRGGRRIGIVGAASGQLRATSSPGAVTVRPALEAVQAVVDALTADGVQVIVLVSHLDDLTEERALVAGLRGIDLAVAGGSDELRASNLARLLPGDEAVGPYPAEVCSAEGRKVPLVSVPGDYRYVGRIIADFDDEGHLVRVDPRSDPVRVIGGEASDAVEPDPQVLADVEQPVHAALDELDETEVGRSEVALDGLSTNLRTQETNLGDLVADALLWAVEEHAFGTDEAPADVAIINGGGIRNNSVVPAGIVTELDTFAMLPFASFVARVPSVDRGEVKALLENAVSQVESSGGRFPQIAGMTVVWQLDAPARTLNADGVVTQPGARIRTVTLDDGTALVTNGQVVPGPPIVLATLDFLARGGDQYPLEGAFATFGVSYQQALRDYVAGALESEIRASAYPEGGAGRLRQVR